jgi:hypothetical protein
MKNSSDTIGYQTRDLLDCSAVPQWTALPRAPVDNHKKHYFDANHILHSQKELYVVMDITILFMSLCRAKNIHCYALLVLLPPEAKGS